MLKIAMEDLICDLGTLFGGHQATMSPPEAARAALVTD